MIVDFNAYVGSFWPGREFVKADPESVEGSLRKTGFDAAFVALLEGPWYRDEQAGNRKLAQLVSKRREFFLPLACVDPTAPYWQEDVDESLENLGMAGIRLYPGYHHYALDDERVVELCRYAAEKGCPVFVTMLSEEDRFAHPAVKVADPKTDEMIRLAVEAADTTFVVNMSGAGPLQKVLTDRSFGRGRLFFDTVKMDKGTIGLDDLLAAAGPQRFLVGTNTPFFSPEGAMLNLAFRTIGRKAVTAILEENHESSPVLKGIIGRLGKRAARGAGKSPDSPAVYLAREDWRSLLGDFYGRIIDQHAHFTSDERLMAEMIEQAKRAGLGKILLNGLGMLDPATFGGWQMFPDSDQIIKMNLAAVEWCKRYPNFLEFIGYINPRQGKPAVEHVEKWVKEYGAVGFKIHGCKEDGSIEKTFPVVEKTAELGVPILFHTFFRKGGNGPAELSPLDIVELARACPEAKLIVGHFGGDWVRAARTIRPYPNIYGDTSGCTHRSGFTEYAVEVIGAERILFGVDMWCRAFGTQIAKITGADISKAEKQLILYKNAERIFGLKADG